MEVPNAFFFLIELNQLTGVAAILNFPLPDIDLEEEEQEQEEQTVEIETWLSYFAIVWKFILMLI